MKHDSNRGSPPCCDQHRNRRRSIAHQTGWSALLAVASQRPPRYPQALYDTRKAERACKSRVAVSTSACAPASAPSASSARASAAASPLRKRSASLCHAPNEPSARQAPGCAQCARGRSAYHTSFLQATQDSSQCMRVTLAGPPGPLHPSRGGMLLQQQLFVYNSRARLSCCDVPLATCLQGGDASAAALCGLLGCGFRSIKPLRCCVCARTGLTRARLRRHRPLALLAQLALLFGQSDAHSAIGSKLGIWFTVWSLARAPPTPPPARGPRALLDCKTDWYPLCSQNFPCCPILHRSAQMQLQLQEMHQLAQLRPKLLAELARTSKGEIATNRKLTALPQC